FLWKCTADVHLSLTAVPTFPVAVLRPVDNSPWSCRPWLGHSMTRFALNPAMPVLSRPDGVGQVGWDPRRAVLVRPPTGLSPTALAELLRPRQSGATLADLQARFDVDAGELVTSLVDAGVVTTAERRRTRAPSIRIHG